MIQFSPVRKIINFLRAVRNELTKVVWPKRDAVIKLTIIVILISVIVGIYLGALDYGFTVGLEKILEF